MRIDKNTTIKLGDRNIVKIKRGDVVIWEKNTVDYFYIESLSNGNTVSLKTNLKSVSHIPYLTPTIEYSTDKQNWTTITFDWSTTGVKDIKIPIVLDMGDKIFFRNDTDKFSINLKVNYDDYTSHITFLTNYSGKVNVGGDIRTLINYRNVENTILEDGMFSNLFSYTYGGTSTAVIVDASNLKLPFTKMTKKCYYEMFNGCYYLTSTPELPATTLAESCYYGMFRGCSSLTTAPELPVTTLSERCYSSMFRGCKKLTSAPTLPATTLVYSCYSSMFSGCEALTSAPTLPATTLAASCYDSMFYGCSKLTTPPELPVTTLAGSCYESMFRDCTGLTSAPELPATTLVSSCYMSMFNGCSSLVKAPELPATTLAYGCYKSMFYNCKALTSAPTLPATTLEDECYNSMFQGCIKLTSAPELPATTLVSYCYNSMFQGCIKLTSAPELPATTLASYCYSSMFQGCTSLTTAPALPATTLTEKCYKSMFQGCSKLNEVTVYADDISASNCTNNWLNGVASTGTFHNLSFATFENGASGIPSGWTEVVPPIQSITANPDTFTIKSYTTSVICTSTLTITTTTGITNTRTNSATITVGENTGDTTRTIVETIPYKGSSYQVTIVQTANDVRPPISWNVVSEGTYPFQLNTNGYYESTNKGKSSSYSYATLNYSGFENLVLECINSGESNYDYGIISQPDVQLSESNTDDGASGSTKVFKNFKGQSSTNPVQLTIPSDEGSHFITIKYRKDGGGDRDNDSLQFKVIEP